MSFAEIRLNDGLIIYDTEGGPEFSTTITTTNSGVEQRNAVWVSPKRRFDVGDRLIREAEHDAIEEFFNARQGRFEGFRFKDWADYKDKGRGILVPIAHTASLATYQLYKNYVSGSTTRTRKIHKPVASTIKAFVDGAQVSAGVLVDSTTGIVSLPPRSIAISAATNANPCVMTTSAPHGLETGDIVYPNITGPALDSDPFASHWTAVNNQPYAVTVLSPTTFSVSINSTGFGFTGGTVKAFPKAGHLLTWTGEFDIPVRFDTDSFKSKFSSASTDGPGNVVETFFYLNSMPVVEIKLP